MYLLQGFADMYFSLISSFKPTNFGEYRRGLCRGIGYDKSLLEAVPCEVVSKTTEPPQQQNRRGKRRPLCNSKS